MVRNLEGAITLGIGIVFIGVLVFIVVQAVIRDNGRKHGGSNRLRNRNNSADNYFFPGADPNLFTGDNDNNNHTRNHHDGNSGNGGHHGHSHGGSSWDSHHGGHGGWDGGGHSHGGGWDGGGHSSGGDSGGGGGGGGGGD
ncbi:hypothetical protein NYE80_08475 [Paenibacillus sp. FSL H7-0357]|uniref:hypothetical protein n=1 Tax=unclassified Paenibacillus TaxID=185978 RepID=UPI0018CCDE90|nr:hypothetical protein [Paenibacillus sp. FSL H7-0357]